MRKIGHIGAALIALAGCVPASAETFINCTSANGPDVVVTLNARTGFGHALSCINSNLISDMVGCAPSEGYGLSSGAGALRLVGVVMRWQEYGNHMGGVVGFMPSQTAYNFSGGFNSPFGGFKEYWRFEASRITGAAKFTPQGKPPIAYQCRVGRQKF